MLPLASISDAIGLLMARTPKERPKKRRSTTDEMGKQKNPDIRTFVSHCVDDNAFVFDVCAYLAPYLERRSTYLFEERPAIEGDFLTQITNALRDSDLYLIFVGKRFDEYMVWESSLISAEKDKAVIVIDIGDFGTPSKLPETVRTFLGNREIIWDNYTHHIPPDTVRCAKDILRRLEAYAKMDQCKNPLIKAGDFRWSDEHLRYGLPTTPNIFDYEKDMITFYIAKRCYEKIEESLVLNAASLPGLESDPAAREKERKEQAELAKAEEKKLKERYAASLSKWPKSEVKKELDKGVRADWPEVYRYPPVAPNPLIPETGWDKTMVQAAALVSLNAPGTPFLFPEAGPRKMNALPVGSALKVAIVVTGGIAPGINAVIDAIVQRHYEYHEKTEGNCILAIVGLLNGFLSFDNVDASRHQKILNPKVTIQHATRGGSILGTSRDAKLLDADPKSRVQRIHHIAAELKREHVDVLYVIGGDGSMKAAHALWHKVNSARENSSEDYRMSVVAIPKTMDNDILWVWQSFGFLSAVEEAREIVERLHNEVRSNPRLGIVQFFGSGSGFVVSHAVLAAATGHTTLALIPEVDFSVLGVAKYIKGALWKQAFRAHEHPDDPAAPIDPSLPHGLIVMAETAIPVDARECLGIKEPVPELKPFYDAISNEVKASDEEKQALIDFIEGGRRVQGQTSDDLRSLGVKILNTALPILIRNAKFEPRSHELNRLSLWDKLRMVRIEPRYLVRALEPSTSDIITGQRLGLLAVDAAMAGYTDCMISQWLTEFVLVPLDLVVLGRKRIPPQGMFWNSVTAKTHQPGDLVAPYVDKDPPST